LDFFCFLLPPFSLVPFFVISFSFFLACFFFFFFFLSRREVAGRERSSLISRGASDSHERLPLLLTRQRVGGKLSRKTRSHLPDKKKKKKKNPKKKKKKKRPKNQQKKKTPP